MDICARYVQIVKGKCTYCVYLQKDFRIIYYVSQNCTFAAYNQNVHTKT